MGAQHQQSQQYVKYHTHFDVCLLNDSNSQQFQPNVKNHSRTTSPEAGLTSVVSTGYSRKVRSRTVNIS